MPTHKTQKADTLVTGDARIMGLGTVRLSVQISVMVGSLHQYEHLALIRTDPSPGVPHAMSQKGI